MNATIIADDSKSTTVTNDMSRKSPQSPWKLEGDYFEGCNCDIVCPCVYLLDPDEGDCHVTCAWHIQKGNYENTDLSNLNVVALFNAPGNMATGPKWKGALYID